MKLSLAVSVCLAVAATAINTKSSQVNYIHEIIQKERRHIVFNSRQLSGECRKYRLERTSWNAHGSSQHGLYRTQRLSHTKSSLLLLLSHGAWRDSRMESINWIYHSTPTLTDVSNQCPTDVVVYKRICLFPCKIIFSTYLCTWKCGYFVSNWNSNCHAHQQTNREADRKAYQ